MQDFLHNIYSCTCNEGLMSITLPQKSVDPTSS